MFDRHSHSHDERSPSIVRHRGYHLTPCRFMAAALNIFLTLCAKMSCVLTALVSIGYSPPQAFCSPYLSIARILRASTLSMCSDEHRCPCSFVMGTSMLLHGAHVTTESPTSVGTATMGRSISPARSLIVMALFDGVSLGGGIVTSNAFMRRYSDEPSNVGFFILRRLCAIATVYKATQNISSQTYYISTVDDVISAIF